MAVFFVTGGFSFFPFGLYLASFFFYLFSFMFAGWVGFVRYEEGIEGKKE